MDEADASNQSLLRFFIASSTPNSVRAEHNLKAVLSELGAPDLAIELEIVDVFSDPQTALANDVIVTPTLLAVGPRGRATLVGDFANGAELRRFLQAFIFSRA
jgi:hypothetical protein